MSNAPRRRWFQFGVGTMLFLVTALAAWLSWELKFIRDRNALGNWLTVNGGQAVVQVRKELADYIPEIVTIPFSVVGWATSQSRVSMRHH